MLFRWQNKALKSFQMPDLELSTQPKCCPTLRQIFAVNEAGKVLEKYYVIIQFKAVS